MRAPKRGIDLVDAGASLQFAAMPIYLYESVDVVPGQTREYVKGFAERWLPLNDEYDGEYLRLSGFFAPDVFYSSQPRVAILWTIPGWEAWGSPSIMHPSAEEEVRKSREFYIPALAWRSGWTDKIIEPLGFSPLPPVRPDSVRPGATVFDHQFVVRPEHTEEFAAILEREIVPAATDAGATLELAARTAGRPGEFIAIWSVPSRPAYAAWRLERAVDHPSYALPGFERAWPLLSDFVERLLTPSWFSPLGGTDAASAAKHIAI